MDIVTLTKSVVVKSSVEPQILRNVRGKTRLD